MTLFVLGPGEPIGMYHWEANQEDFFVLSGEGAAARRGRGAAVATVGLRPLPRRDEAHHRRRRRGALRRARARRARSTRRARTGAATPVDEVALRHGAGVEAETTDADEAYARFRRAVADAVRRLAPA